ncbi:hypothetical protein EV359DRAFT_10548, partial [Lentinula novae-zelandiae]
VSDDLKKCIYRWYTVEKLTIEDCAGRAGCSVGLVAKVLKNMQEFGAVNNPNSKHTGRPREVDNGDELYIKEVLKARPTIYLDELQLKLGTVRHID